MHIERLNAWQHFPWRTISGCCVIDTVKHISSRRTLNAVLTALVSLLFPHAILVEEGWESRSTTMKKQKQKEKQRERERERESVAHTETRVLRCFTVYTHSVHHWSSLHEATGSSVPVPIALGIVYKTSASCRAFQSSALSFVFLLSSRSLVPSLSFFPSFSFSRTICFSSSPALSRCSNWMPDNKGDCMYYLACLPHACPDSSQSTFESRHDRYKALRSQCNAIKSNPPCILSRTWNPYYIYN